ncbi:hemicentin-1-like [Mugil cephalus]|uniref:hemicentin-1-like n=1 Tax=Mugil cephalus TaxID=48193 RepID=UPI001FB694AF|nr:hemicentin-1-like [Mugil cephalus]
MVEFRWIQISLFLILMLQFTAAPGQFSSVTVTGGHEVTLSCGNVIDGQKNCDSTTWIFSSTRTSSSVELVNLGQIRSEPDRLRVTSNCSLVIKKVTDDDAGLYACRQFDKSGQQQGTDFLVDLSVITKSTGQRSSLTVTAGHDVILPCENVINGQKNCYDTTWLFFKSRNTAVVLVSDGQIKSKPARLRVTTNCSLVIKKVTVDEDGEYACRRLISGGQNQDVLFALFVINILMDG